MAAAIIKIPLTNSGYTIIDETDLPLAMRHRWLRKRESGPEYAATNARIGGKRKTVYLHRLLLGEPPGMQVDHRNGDGLDNRRCNLRLCNAAQNQWNTLARIGTSNFKGVYWVSSVSRWRARISLDKKRVHLGDFKSEVDAARAYDGSARKHYGEFAVLNFPDRKIDHSIRYALDHMEEQ